MRVLHLPVNNGSRTSHTVRALRQRDVNAVGLVRTRADVQSPEGLEVISLGATYFSALRSIAPWVYALIKFIRWADVVHWYSGAMALPFGLDLAIVKHFRKPGIAEWQGVEIRIPEVEFPENPYYTKALANGYEYKEYESLEQSRRLQKRFQQAGFACSAPPGMAQYIQKDIFAHHYILPRRLILSDYQPIFPQMDVSRPIVVHSPTAPIGKGTAAVLREIEQLKAHHNLDFRLIQGMSRRQAVGLVKKADIFLDQFVSGDFGSAALEAMAMGKPVVSYIKPSVAAQYHPSLPVVQATQDNLAHVLGQLLQNPTRRQNLGQQGRAYVEKHHNAIDVADELKNIYQKLLSEK